MPLPLDTLETCGSKAGAMVTMKKRRDNMMQRALLQWRGAAVGAAMFVRSLLTTGEYLPMPGFPLMAPLPGELPAVSMVRTTAGKATVVLVYQRVLQLRGR